MSILKIGRSNLKKDDDVYDDICNVCKYVYVMSRMKY
jgi:hypothetical protein